MHTESSDHHQQQQTLAQAFASLGHDLDQQQAAYNSALAAFGAPTHHNSSPHSSLGGEGSGCDGSMDATLQSMLLLQHQQSTAASDAATVAAHGGSSDLTQLLGQLASPPGLEQQLAGMGPVDTTVMGSPQQPSWHNQHVGGTSSPTQEYQPSTSNGPRVFVPDSLKAAAAAAATTTPTTQQMLLQAALGGQQPQPDAASLLQEQLLLQALQQQTASAAQPNNMQAALAAAMSAAGATAPAGLGHQHALTGPLAALLGGNNNMAAAGNTWPFASPPGLNLNDATGTTGASAAAAAAALLAAQQQQQQAALMRAMTPGSLLGAPAVDANMLQVLLSQQGLSGGAAAPNVLNQLQPWAIKALTAQMQQGAGANLAAYSQQLALASLMSSSTTNTFLARPGAQGGPQGRRSRTGRRSSGTAAAAIDLANSFGLGSRAGSVAGSDVAGDGKGGLPTVLPAGVSMQDLAPGKFEDTWSSGAAEDATATTGNVIGATGASLLSSGSCRLARGASSASSSSMDSVTEAQGSLCGSALSISTGSRAGSGATAAESDKWQWDSHFCSLDDDAVTKGSSGVAGRACRKTAAKAGQQDDTAKAKDQSSAGSKGAAAVAAAGGCSMWLPGAREAAGDDSWYLPRPPTCRLFVGNIGCWVDEAMLLAYFGKYGHVVDVQVRSS